MEAQCLRHKGLIRFIEASFTHSSYAIADVRSTKLAKYHSNGRLLLLKPDLLRPDTGYENVKGLQKIVWLEC